MNTVIQLNKMMFGRRTLTAAALLVLLMNFSGYTHGCHQWEYEIGNECCPLCSAGHHVKTDCTAVRSTSCDSCTEGTYMNQPTGLKSCFRCASCDAGSGLKIKKSCTRTSDTVCEPLEGYYCIDPVKDSCVAAQKHTRCTPGRYISQKGTALTDTECSDCSGGTYSDGTFTSCQPHTQCEIVKNQGTVSTDAECGEESSVLVPIVVAVIVVLALLFLPVAIWFFKKKHKSQSPDALSQEQGGALLFSIRQRVSASKNPVISTLDSAYESRGASTNTEAKQEVVDPHK